MGFLGKLAGKAENALNQVSGKIEGDAGASADAPAVSEAEAYARAQGENCVLLQLLDETLTGELAKGLGDKDTLPAGFTKQVEFKDRSEGMKAMFEKRRGNNARMRGAMTHTVEGAVGGALAALHGNKVTNIVSAKVEKATTAAKATAVDAMQGTGKKSDEAEATTEGEDMDIFGVPGKASSMGQFAVKFNSLGYTSDAIVKAFGTEELREKMWPGLGSGYLNSAATGCVPESVRLARRAWAVQYQLNPVVFRFVNLANAVRQAELQIAELIEVDPADIVFTTGAEQGTSTVLRALPWRVGDALIYVDDVSDPVKRAIRSIHKSHGVEIICIKPSAYPYTANSLQTQLKKALGGGLEGRVRCAVVAEVGAKSGVVVDVGSLCKFFHSKKISVLCDGTHAVGHLPEPCHTCDWYTASLTNWCYAEAGVGILVVQPAKQVTTQTLTVSYFDRGCASKSAYSTSYLREFSYSGLQDFGNYLSVRQAIAFTRLCGWKKIREYCNKLAKEVVDAVTKVWGTTPIQESGKWGSMPVIPLPKGRDEKYNALVAAQLTAHLSTTPCRDNKFGKDTTAAPCCVQITSLHIDGINTLCARFTCQVFNNVAEYVTAAKFIASLCPYNNISSMVDETLVRTFL